MSTCGHQKCHASVPILSMNPEVHAICRDAQHKATPEEGGKAGPAQPPSCGRKNDFIVWLQLQGYQRTLYKVTIPNPSAQMKEAMQQ